jgi:hypothetical protein
LNHLKIHTGIIAAAMVMVICHVAGGNTIAVDEIKKGMKGYGLTVFEGTKPEKFQVEVVDVVPKFLLRQDIILIRVSHPVTDRAGIIGGMSGSPIYIDGRLAGALAYAWRFQKEPIAGVTPINNMLDVLKRKIGKDRPSVPMRLARVLFPFVSDLARQAPITPIGFHASFAPDDNNLLAPARTPITLSGFLGSAMGMIDETLSTFGMVPMMGGAGGKDANDPGKFVPGGAIGVQLVRGDMSATGIGTVTVVRDENVLAFGHPMFNMGQGLLPVTTGRIHTVIASLNRSNKLGSPLGEIGTMVQDRQACVVARTDRRAPMIPVTFELKDFRSGRKEKYRVEMISHRLLTARFLHAVLVNIIQNAASDATDVTAEITGRIEVSGRDPVKLHDAAISRRGLAPLARYFRPSGIVAAILANPFEDATIEAIEFDVQLRYGLEHSTIVGAYVTAQNPVPGDIINLHVRLRAYGGDERIVTVPIRIPETSQGEKIQIQVGGGDSMTPVMPTPQNLDDMIKNVERFYPPQSIVVSVNIPGEGVSLRGHVLEQLPNSAVSALKPSVGVEQLTTHRTALTEVYPTSHLVAGKETITILVGSRRTR